MGLVILRFGDEVIELPYVLLMTVLVDEGISAVVEANALHEIQNQVNPTRLFQLCWREAVVGLAGVEGERFGEVQRD